LDWLAFAVLGVAELVEAEVLVDPVFAFEMFGSVFWHAVDHMTITRTMKNAVNVRRALDRPSPTVSTKVEPFVVTFKSPSHESLKYRSREF
jgi:hypothetical protein